RQLGTGNRTLQNNIPSESIELGRSAGVASDSLTGFLDQLLLLDQASEVLFMQHTPGQCLYPLLQLPQTEFLGHELKYHRAVFDFGPQPSHGGSQNATMVKAHGGPESMPGMLLKPGCLIK